MIRLGKKCKKKAKRGKSNFLKGGGGKQEEEKPLPLLLTQLRASVGAQEGAREGPVSTWGGHHMQM